MDRLQGTDGIRAVCIHSSHPRVRGLSPLEAFERERAITEEFMELYAYSYVRMLMDDGLMREGDDIAIGWDPRDPSETFAAGAARGIVSAGARCLRLGVAPTPVVALYMLHRKAKGAVVVTASHNLNDQNGIKLFMAPFGIKPFPEDDVRLTARIRGHEKDYRHAAGRGKILEAGDDASALLSKFMEDRRNSWLSPKTDFRDTVLVVDTAHGAYSGLMPDIASGFGFREVIVVNDNMSGDVNLHSGVAELEGETSVGKDLRSDAGKDFSSNKLMRTLMELGRLHKGSIEGGEVRLLGAAFDADGDRASLLLYNPWRERIEILSGDDMALHQLGHMRKIPDTRADRTFVTTVESDPMLLKRAKQMGYRTALIPVGDKWILHNVLHSLLTARANEIQDESRKKEIIGDVEDLMKDPRLDNTKINSIARMISRDPWGLMSPIRTGALPFSLGSEYTGHCITQSFLKRSEGSEMMAFVGNGMKSAINTLVSLKGIAGDRGSEETFEEIASPFPKGVSRTFYSYYTDKSMLRRGDPLTEEMEERLIKLCGGGPEGDRQVRSVKFDHDPGMIFVNVTERDGSVRGWAFIRNSGTEDKTGINVRGPAEDSEPLTKAGQEMIRYVNIHMKDPSHPYAHAERRVLEQLYPERALPSEEISVNSSGVWLERLLAEMTKEGFIEKTDQNYRLTGMGRWFFLAAPPIK